MRLRHARSCLWSSVVGCALALAASVQAQTCDPAKSACDSGFSYTRPDEVDISGNLRRVEMPSSLGRLLLRWPRSAEVLFGRTPERAFAEAARAASRALKSGGFPPQLATAELPLSVVFIDDSTPAAQIPPEARSGCHPGWMIPPGDIYIYSERVSSGCGSSARSKESADALLTRVLLHEIGHAVENLWLNGLSGQDHMRAEGFASWFEGFSSDFTTLVPRGSVRREYISLAALSFRGGGQSYQFSGSPEDYGRAALFFMALEKRRGIGGLADLYRGMENDQAPFIESFRKASGMSDADLAQEFRRLLSE